MKFYCHPRCSTCKKAEKWLKEEGISYEPISLLEETPAKAEWIQILSQTDRTLKSYFNTSGNVYRENNLKDKLPEMTVEEAADWLSSNGMVVKRPFAIEGEVHTSGFKQAEYAHIWGKETR